MLRTAPLGVVACYYVGSLPFVLGLLYFWADMSKSAFAYSQVASGSFGLALLFVWMKTWQTVFARYLWREVCGESNERWSVGRYLRVAVRQTILQASGLFLLPVALLATIPFSWVYAFYQSATVLDDGGRGDLRGLIRKAVALSRRWQKQNILLIWTLSPYLMVVAAGLFLVIMPVIRAITLEWTGFFLYAAAAVFVFLLTPLSPLGVIIAANIGAAIIYVPDLVKTLLGIQTIFVRSPAALFNSTFFAIVCGLTYLCMDPAMKASYVLRCFYAESLGTGEDLRVELRRFANRTGGMARKATFLLILWLAILMNSDASASDKSQPLPGAVVEPAELDRALDDELSHRRYVWRMPKILRSQLEDEEGRINSFFERVINKLADWGKPILRRIDRFLEWLKDLFPERQETERRKLSEISDTLRIILYTLSGVLLCIVGVMLWRAWRQRGSAALEVIAQAADVRPDIEDENILAADLPEDEWLALAQELMEKGEYRQALRAVFMASLAYLGERNLVHIARFKSNRDYKQELERRAHAQPQVLEAFSHSASMYEAVWYGLHEATREMIGVAIRDQETLRVCEQAQ
ncbi:MAG: hypothetical protein Kow0099_17850 [Candidatus Abyssubacteria bacterium]